MSGILFLLEVAAFVLVAYWAYSNDKAQPSTGAKGLLRMKGAATADAAPSPGRTPKWKKTPTRNAAAPAAEPAGPVTNLSQPKWKRQLRFQKRR